MDMSNVIESGNFFVLIIACYVVWRTVRWRMRSDLDPFTRSVICCWLFVFMGIGINRGWFAMSRFLHDEGSHWQAIMFEWRWLLVVSTATMAGWGALSFVEMIDESGSWKKYWVFSAAVVSSLGLGFY